MYRTYYIKSYSMQKYIYIYFEYSTFIRLTAFLSHFSCLLLRLPHCFSSFDAFLPLPLSLPLSLLQVISWLCFLPFIYLIISKFVLQTRSMWNATCGTQHVLLQQLACLCVCVCSTRLTHLFVCLRVVLRGCVCVCVCAANLIKTVNSTQNMLPGETVAVAQFPLRSRLRCRRSPQARQRVRVRL